MIMTFLLSLLSDQYKLLNDSVFPSPSKTGRSAIRSNVDLDGSAVLVWRSPWNSRKAGSESASKSFSSCGMTDGKAGPEVLRRAAGMVVWMGPGTVMVVVIE